MSDRSAICWRIGLATTQSNIKQISQGASVSRGVGHSRPRSSSCSRTNYCYGLVSLSRFIPSFQEQTGALISWRWEQALVSSLKRRLYETKQKKKPQTGCAKTSCMTL